jgi:hypothetical protein
MDIKTEEVLNKIIELKGDCLKYELCVACPFRSKCLPKFIDNETKLSRQERYNLAANHITNFILMDDHGTDGII